jgi:hypothetical protein
MGQDTWATIGATVTYALTYQNIENIKRLYNKERIMCYIHPIYCKCHDEISEPINHDDVDDEFDISFLLGSTSEKMFNDYLEQHISLFGRFIHFMAEITSVYVKGISRRGTYTPNIWVEQGLSIQGLIDGIKKAKQIFLDLGVPEHLIIVGSTMCEDQ